MTVETIPNGDDPVSRRECSIVHSALSQEVRRSLRQIKWIIGISTSAIITLCMFSLTQSFHRQLPPEWFIDRVERLEATVTLRLEKLELRVDGVENAIQKLDLRVDRLERTIQRRLDDVEQSSLESKIVP